MAAHKLSLDIPDILNSCALRVLDTSIYADNLGITCTKLQITVPGFSTSYIIENLTPKFTLNLTACDIGVQTTNCGVEYNDLPDGVYVLTYSVSPNNLVFVEYNYLRTTKTINRIRNIYCELELGACEPGEAVKSKLDKLLWIEQLLEAAKAKVEVCRQVPAGIQIYKYAEELLNRLQCKGRNCR